MSSSRAQEQRLEAFQWRQRSTDIVCDRPLLFLFISFLLSISTKGVSKQCHWWRLSNKIEENAKDADNESNVSYSAQFPHSHVKSFCWSIPWGWLVSELQISGAGNPLQSGTINPSKAKWLLKSWMETLDHIRRIGIQETKLWDAPENSGWLWWREADRDGKWCMGTSFKRPVRRPSGICFWHVFSPESKLLRHILSLGTLSCSFFNLSVQIDRNS